MAHRVDLYVQPAYNYDTKKVEYAEILIRGYRGISSVKNILTFIKRSSIEDVFDIDVLEETLKVMNRHQELRHPIGVNLCPGTINKDGIADKILDTIEKYNIENSKIIIEINEETNFKDDIVQENINILRNAGIKIALDDFGVENSNLYSLLNGNVDILKVDKAFIDSAEEEYENNQYKVLKSLFQICTEFNIDHVVEGIETKSQLKNIKELGYNVVQGYLYEKPIPFEQYLINNENKKCVTA